MDDQGQLVTGSLSELVAERSENLREQVATFGTGGWARVYAGGPLARVVGRRLDAFPVVTADGLSLDLDRRGLYENVDPDSQLTPAYVTGESRAGRRAGTSQSP